MKAVPAVVAALVALWLGHARAAAPPAPAAPPVGGCPSAGSPLLVPVAGTTYGKVLIDPDCQYIYLTNTTYNRIDIFSLATQSFEAPIQVGAQPIGMDVTDDGTRLYVANSGGNNISVVDLVQRIELRKVTVPASDDRVLPVSIAIAANGTALFVATKTGGGSLKQLDLTTEQVTLRDDLSPGRVTERSKVVASRDRSTVVILAGGTSSGPVTFYRSASNSFVGTKDLSTLISDASVDAAGSTVLVTPGTFVVDDWPSMAGTIIPPPQGTATGGNAMDPTRALGYRSVGSKVEAMNLQTFLKIGELPLGDSVSTAGLNNYIGDMAISPDGMLLAVITNTGFSIVRPLDTAPQKLNLVRNGGFGGGMTNWQTYATPDPSYIQSEVADGVFRYNRLSPPPGSANQAVVFQETGLALPAGAPIQARFDLGNSSSVRKRISVLLIDADWSDIQVCTFWLPPNSPLATYRMRSHTTKAWTNAAIYFYAATDGVDGGFNLIDDVSLQYDTAFAGDVTACVDPLAPAAAGGGDGPEMLANGDFGSGALGPWGTYGTLTWQLAGGVFEFVRATDTMPAGLVWQSSGQPVDANEILTASFELGNSSAVRKRVTVLMHDLDFGDLSACTFWLEPGQALSPYAMRTFATEAWGNATLSIYAATIGPQGWIRLDNAGMRRTPSASIVGTECVEPAVGASAPSTPGVTGQAATVFRKAATARGAVAGGPRGGGARAAPSAPPSGPFGARDSVLVAVHAAQSQPIDLTDVASARIIAESWLAGDGRGELQISADGVNWVPLVEILPSGDWVAVEADLEAWVGQVAALRFVQYGEGSKPAASWRWRGIRLITIRR